MRLYGWSVAAITLMVFGGAPAEDPGRSQLLHTEVLPLMASDGCPLTAALARHYLVPSIEGGERLAYVCHGALRATELEDMQRRAAARNTAPTP